MRLIGKNVLAYLLSLLTASLLFPFILMAFKGSSYGWWLVLILLGSGIASILIPEILFLVLFNLVVVKAKVRFNTVGRLVLLGGALSGLFYSVLSALFYRGSTGAAIENTALMILAGGIFGFYYGILTKLPATKPTL